MQFRHRLPTRLIGPALVCVFALTQTGCATLQLSPASAPGSGQTDPPSSSDGGANRSSPASTVGVVIVTVVGGYLLYKLFFDDSDEETPTMDPEPSGFNFGAGVSSSPESSTPPAGGYFP